MIAIVISEFHPKISNALLNDAENALKKHGVEYAVFRVPGAFEIPFMIKKLAKKKSHDIFIALGCVIKGKTKHFELVSENCARGCMDVMLKEKVPVVFEVLACDSEKDAFKRSHGALNRGRDAARVALFWLSHVF